MARRRAGSGLVSGLIFLLVAAGLGYGVWFGLVKGDSPALAADLLSYRVQPIELEITAIETGTLMSASSVRVKSEVESRVPIVSLVPDGTRVEVGDVVVELESTQLQTSRTEQQIAVEKARSALSQAQQNDIVARSQTESDVQKAELGVELAELDLKGYLEGNYPLDLRVLQTETKLAEEEAERAKAQLPVLEELHRDGYKTDSEIAAERLKVKRAEAKVEIAKEKELLLHRFTFPRQKRDFESKVTEAKRLLERVKNLAKASVDQAQTNLKAQESSLRLEEGKLTRLEDQIQKCTLRAPAAGLVLYPIPEDEDMVEQYIKEGNEVRRQQHVFSIPDTDVLEVAVAFNEAVSNQIKPGMPVRVGVDVRPDLLLTGTVRQISSFADPEDWRKSSVKFYQAKIGLTEQADGLRPGNTVKVEVLIDRLSNVLAVPVQAVVQRGKAGVCYVLEGGVPVLRRITLGKSGIEHVAVLEGLSEGELIVLSPDHLGLPADAFAAEERAVLADPVDDGSAPSSEPEVPIQETEYKAVMPGDDGCMAEAEYETQYQDGAVLKREFDVQVIGGPPGATWELTLDGIVVGSVTIDAAGNGLGEWSTKKGTMPAEFPLSASQGSKVTLGPLEGELTH